MRLTHVKTPASPLPQPLRPSLHFGSFNIMIPEDPEQVDPEQGLGTTESLQMSGYSSRFLSEWVVMALKAT